MKEGLHLDGRDMVAPYQKKKFSALLFECTLWNEKILNEMIKNAGK